MKLSISLLVPARLNGYSFDQREKEISVVDIASPCCQSDGRFLKEHPDGIRHFCKN